MVEEQEIVIIGAGICGLATAIALHKKGIKSVVLERSEVLRSSGAAIGIQDNGWRALHQLGVASILRKTASTIEGARDIWIEKGSNKKAPIGVGESRCLRRSDLINALADALPPGTIRFGCQIVSVTPDPFSPYHVIQQLDGRSILAKILIGCDGLTSVIAKFLNLSPVKEFGLMATRGLTTYPNGHPFPPELVRIRIRNILFAQMPIDDKTMHWFVIQQSPTYKELDPMAFPDPDTILNSALESTQGLPKKYMKMIEQSDIDSISLSRVRYRSPWSILVEKFRKGTVTVAGDANHVMGPFTGQGGSACIEDAIVLARCLSKVLNNFDENIIGRKMMAEKVGEAMDEYLKQRKRRVLRLSTQTYLMGIFFMPSTSKLVKITCILLVFILFINPNNHVSYDVGTL